MRLRKFWMKELHVQFFWMFIIHKNMKTEQKYRNKKHNSKLVNKYNRNAQILMDLY